MALTKKERALVAQRKILNNLYLFRDFELERIEDNDDIYFYKQVNPFIGCLIFYFCSKQKDYSLQGFDLFICETTNGSDAIKLHRNDEKTKHHCRIADFWIPCFHAEKENHLSCFIELINEKEVNISKIDLQYAKEYSCRIKRDRK